jgi:hypothetical protein
MPQSGAACYAGISSRMRHPNGNHRMIAKYTAFGMSETECEKAITM